MHTYKNSNLKYEPYKKLHFWNFSRPLSNGQCECCKDHSCKEECIFKDHICGVVIISAFPLPRSCVGVLTRMACSAGRSERERVLMMIAVIRWSRLARLIIYCWGRGHPPTTSLGIWVNQSCAARSRAHNRMVIIRGVITCESAGNNNMLARGCVTRFNFFDLLHWWSAGWMGGGVIRETRWGRFVCLILMTESSWGGCRVLILKTSVALLGYQSGIFNCNRGCISRNYFSECENLRW